MKIVQDDPRSINYVCPACQSPEGSKCTKPTDTGRVTVAWFHHSRTALIGPVIVRNSRELDGWPIRLP